MAIAKIILNQDTQIDLTQDTTDAQYTLQGYTGHKKDGTAFTGTYTPPAPSLQSKTATPTTSSQTIQPDSGYDGLSSVTVNEIPSEYVIPSGTKSISITSNGTTTEDVGGYASAQITVNVAGSTDVKTGTLTVASNVNTSTSTQITTTTAIGFTPTKFLFWKDERTGTNNHVHQTSFITIGSYYVRTMSRYSNSSFSTSGNATSWTTQTAGYLYYSSNTIYFRSSSSYILSAGTWHWVAIQ